MLARIFLCSFAKGKTARRRQSNKKLEVPVTPPTASRTLVGAANNAETIGVGAEVRGAEAPITNLSVGGEVVPRTATVTAVRTRRRACVRCGACYASIPIPVPFPHVPAHVVQSVVVRVLRLYAPRSCIVRVFTTPCHFIIVVASGVGVVLSAAGSPFPFSRCRKPVAVCVKTAHCGVPRTVF